MAVSSTASRVLEGVVRPHLCHIQHNCPALVVYFPTPQESNLTSEEEAALMNPPKTRPARPFYGTSHAMRPYQM